MVPLLRGEGGEKESQFGLVAPEDGRLDTLPCSDVSECGGETEGNIRTRKINGKKLTS